MRELSPAEVAELGLDAPERELSPEEVAALGLDGMPQVHGATGPSPDATAGEFEDERKPGVEDLIASKGSQGYGFGLIDESAGLANAVGDVAGRAGHALGLDAQDPDEISAPAGRPKAPASPVEAYTQGRDRARAAEKRVDAEFPNAGTFVETAGAMLNPLGNKVGAGGKLAKAAYAGGMGALNSFGHAEGDVGDQAIQTGVGALTSAGLQAGGDWLTGKLGKLAGWARGKGDKAAADGLALEEKAKEKLVGSEQGTLYGKIADINRGRKIGEENAAALAEHAPELAAKLKAAANDPRAIAKLKASAENHLERMTSGLDEYDAQLAKLAEAKAIDPAARNAEKLGSTFKTAVLPRARYMADKAIPLATGWAGSKIGDALDGDENSKLGKYLGAGLGFTGGVMLGRGGTQIANMFATPTMRHAMAGVGEKAAQWAGAVGEKALPAMELEATDDPEKYLRLVEWLRGR